MTSAAVESNEERVPSQKWLNNQKIREAERVIEESELTIGNMYIHYKVFSERQHPTLYQLISIGIDEETLRAKVALRDVVTGRVWYRFLEVFTGTVTVNIAAEENVVLPRFQLVADRNSIK